MMAELGVFSLVLALFFSLLLVIAPSALLWKKESNAGCVMIRLSRWYIVGQSFFLALAYLCLTICFLQDDFSVIYVLNHSSVLLPWFYKACAVWGGHEGSMLLWVNILSVWTLAVCFCSQSLDAAFRVRLFIVLGMLVAGFILFILITSNPFLRQFDVLNTQGRDLNPLLQDPGFLFHPPMLYMGYVGCSVGFAFAVAILWIGKMNASWAQWLRPWVLASWCCLTTGITLGSWWAYRELGWGGWWFWDPVENASFMPWLVSTALLHSLIVTARIEAFKSWTVLLGIAAFSLSLVGTFLVRSGVLTSVHAFAVDPTRGLYILAFLCVVVGGSLTLFASRAAVLTSHKHGGVYSREGFLLLNNVFLVVMMLTVLLGTVYPLFMDALGLGKLSVGAPYFNTVFVPLMMPLLACMGIGIHLHWHHDQWRRLYKRYLMIIIFSILPAFLVYFFCRSPHSASVYSGLILASWVIISTLTLAYTRWFSQGIKGFNASFLGMLIAHTGVAVTVIGIAVSTGMGIEKDLAWSLGETVTFAGAEITFLAEKPLQASNYTGTEATFRIRRQHHKDRFIYPQKRLYTIGNIPMTEAAIETRVGSDMYIALGEPLNALSTSNTSNKHAWSVRLYYKPLIRWIWGGGLMLLIGGLLALFNGMFIYLRKGPAMKRGTLCV